MQTEYKIMLVATFLLLAIKCDAYSAVGFVSAVLLVGVLSSLGERKSNELAEIKSEIQFLKDKINFSKLSR